jgi:uncharacterized protein (DUF1800 family)
VREARDADDPNDAEQRASHGAFIATNLARHFVSDDPPAALVDRCAGLATH